MKPLYYPFRFAGRCTYLLFVVALLPASCNNDKGSGHSAARKITGGGAQHFSTEAFIKTLTATLPAVDTTDSLYKKRGRHTADAGMRLVYQTNGYKPLWLAEDGITDAAELLLKDLDSLQWDGINPARYGIKGLSAKLDRLKSGGDLSDAIAFDTSCTRAYLKASRDLLMGVLSPRTADSLWFHTNDSVWGAPRALLAFAADGAYPPLAKYRSGIPTYSLLRAEYMRYHALSSDSSLKALKGSIAGKTVRDSIAVAVITKELPWIIPVEDDTMNATRQQIRGFQERYGLAPTGRADSITVARLRMMPDTVMHLLAANMERLRWMPQILESQHILVDIPLMELFYRRDGDDAFHMKVVVGRPSRQTPALNADMANIVFSPAWCVPPTILRQEVLPGISSRGSNYLARKGLRAYDRHGRVVSASAIRAGNCRSFTFRQPPGARNALGEVKFNLPNIWDIYLHDTPHREDFPKRYRAKSSGCVRVEHPREFAEFLLKDIEGRSQFDSCGIDSIIGTRKTRYEQLQHKIPVHIVYLTAFEDESRAHIRLLPDIYGKDGKLMAALTRIGGIN